MESRFDELESQIQEIGNALRGLERRVVRLEGGGAAEEPKEPAEPWSPAPAVGGTAKGWLPAMVPLVGRALLLLGGAFLLRALTDLEAVPNVLGLVLGFLYAMLLVLAADRSAARPQGAMAANFYAVVGALVAFSLVVEAATRFELIGVAAAAAGIGIAAGALLALASRRELRTAAAAASLGGGLSLLALLRSFPEPAAALIVLAILGLAVLWTCDRHSWRPWKWSSALLADLGFAIFPAGIASGRFTTEPDLATGLLLALFTAYVLLFSARSLLHGRSIGVFEVVQTLFAGVVAFGGAWRIAGADALAPGLTALILGVAAYSVAFSRAVRHDRRRSFLFFTSLGLALVGVGSLRFLTAEHAALVWSVLAIVCAAGSARYRRVTLSLHSTVYVLAALLASGLALAATAGFWMPDPASWPEVDSAQLAVILALGICLVIPAARSSQSWGWLSLMPRAALFLFFVWVAGGALLAYFAPRYLGTGGDVDAGALATSRTGLLAIAALLLAWLSRRPRFVEAGWLVYPLLALAAFRVLSQDILAGRPVTLFVSLALLGASLIASARWLHHDRAADDEP